MHLRVIPLFILLALYGCAKPPQGASTITPAIEASAPAALTQPVKKMAALPQVAILVSENTPAYSKVADALVKKLGRRASLVYLSDNQPENFALVSKLNNDEPMQIVSIGLDASLAAKQLTTRQNVFCQVYNYQDHGLLSPRHKGISMLPSFKQAFRAWRTLSPRITEIGIISGPGFADAIQSASAAAKSYGFTLHHVTVNSDKEYQYAYKAMHGKVQGYWLLPDNRVLSGHIVRDIMTFSVRNSKQVAVFSDELLKLGGLISFRSDPKDVAQQVWERLQKSQNSDEIPGPDIVYLDKLILRINPVMAQNLGLKIPAHYRKLANAP